MCGILITWCIGRNNNGPIGPDNPVRGENINTRVVKLLPVNAKKDAKTDEEQQERQEEGESGKVVAPEQEMNSLGDGSGSKAQVHDANVTDIKPPAQISHTRAIISDFTNAIAARSV